MACLPPPRLGPASRQVLPAELEEGASELVIENKCSSKGAEVSSYHTRKDDGRRTLELVSAARQLNPKPKPSGT